NPEKILKMPVDTGAGWQDFNSRKVTSFLGLDTHPNAKALSQQMNVFLKNLYSFFWAKDCSIVEINPLAIVGEGDASRIIALDAKINFDDNSLTRHKDLQELRDESEEDPKELEAA